MVDTVAMSANAERVIKPRTFIPPKPGLRRQIEPTAAESGCQTAALQTRLGFRRAKATPDHLEGKSCPAWPFHLRHDPRIKAASGARRSQRREPQRQVRHAPSTGCFEFEIWSGARCVVSPHSGQMSQDIVDTTNLGGGTCPTGVATSSRRSS